MKEQLLGQGPTVNPLTYPSVKCDQCGNEIFEEKIIFKIIPGLVAGTGGDDVHYPIPVYVCSKCGAYEPKTRELIEKGNAKAEQKKKENELNHTQLIL